MGLPGHQGQRSVPEAQSEGIDGQTPTDRSDGTPMADVLDLNELRRCRLIRKSFAHGLLNSYWLEPVAEAV
ncbi:hypothetical protein ACFL5O_10555 [Myxococcota bacterium]